VEFLGVKYKNLDSLKMFVLFLGNIFGIKIFSLVSRFEKKIFAQEREKYVKPFKPNWSVCLRIALTLKAFDFAHIFFMHLI
jgi:hypothetical protein